MLATGTSHVLCEREQCPTVNGAQVAIRANGSVLIASEQGIVTFDSSGTKQTLARTGSGPGELRFALALGVDRLDRVLAFDIGNGRQSRWATDTSPAHVGTMPPRTMLSLNARAGILHAVLLPPAAARGDTVLAAVVRHEFDSVSTWTDTVARVRAPALFVVGSEGMFPPSVPWEWGLRWDVCGNGDVLLAANDRWQIQRMVRGAPVAATAGRHLVPRPVTDADRAALASRPFMRTAPPAYREALRAELVQGPTVHPVIMDLHCGQRGDAWIEEPVTADSSVLRRLDRDGRLTGSVALPRATRVMAIREPWVVGLETSADDELRVVRLTIDTTARRQGAPPPHRPAVNRLGATSAHPSSSSSRTN
ncbi:MAG: hypothetical protein MUE41_12120, partial [Gemmatimonadaceae bacterium]|nr:hypothetical protein [Gemmatimonadaceae bacterium]